MKVLVMGAGKMVEAILLGLKNKIDLGDFHIYSPSGKSAQILAEKVGAVFLESLDDMSNPDFVFIGCKPQQLNQLAPSIVGKFEDATIVSMLAALTEKTQLRVLKAKKLIRIMPNLPVRFNQGVTLISSDSAQEDLPKLNDLFSNLGLVQVLSENELEELTLLTGSGPAFFYELTKLMAESFSSLDSISREKLARSVLSGAGISATSESHDLNTMLGNVTSKAGVTIAVIEEWRRLNMDELVLKGIEAGKERSRDLASTIDQK